MPKKVNRASLATLGLSPQGIARIRRVYGEDYLRALEVTAGIVRNGGDSSSLAGGLIGLIPGCGPWVPPGTHDPHDMGDPWVTGDNPQSPRNPKHPQNPGNPMSPTNPNFGTSPSWDTPYFSSPGTSPVGPEFADPQTSPNGPGSPTSPTTEFGGRRILTTY